MIALSPTPEIAMLAVVQQWCTRLAHGEMEAACTMLDEPNSYGIVWTPTLLWSVIHETFPVESLFYRVHPEGPRVTDLTDMEDVPPYSFGQYTDGSGYFLNYPLPLNREWSDLTAQFEFLQRSAGYAFVLHDMHVL